jgi:hypothetical protein
MPAKAEDWIEHRAGRAGEWQTIGHSHRRPDPASAPEEAPPVGLELQVPNGVAFHDGEMRCPSLRVGWRAPPPGRQNSTDIRDELRFDEELRERWVRIVGSFRRQNDFSI